MTCVRFLVNEGFKSSYLDKKKRKEIKKNILNINDSTLRLHIIIQKKNYFSHNRVVNMAKIALFGTFNLNFLKILT